jgi:hypothetical protein
MKNMARKNFWRLAFLSLVLTSLLLAAGLFGTVSVKANGSLTTTTLDVSPLFTLFGEPVALTATVTSNSGTPTGSVEFFDSVTSLGTASLAAGTASKSISTLEPGYHYITAVYSGDVNFPPSTSESKGVGVMFKATQTTLTGAPETSIFGQTVTLTATVIPSPPGGLTPSGIVDFNIQSTRLTRNMTGELDVSGTATVNLSDLPMGTYQATAYYEGMIGYFSSTSTEFVFHVTAPGLIRGVGGEVQGINKAGIFAPLILLVSVLIIGGVFVLVKRRRAG